MKLWLASQVSYLESVAAIDSAHRASHRTLSYDTLYCMDKVDDRTRYFRDLPPATQYRNASSEHTCKPSSKSCFDDILLELYVVCIESSKHWAQIT